MALEEDHDLAVPGDDRLPAAPRDGADDLRGGPGRRMLSLYLNVFVGVVQAFQEVPALKAMAPTQSEPPFLVGQLIVIAIVIVLGIRAVIRFRPMATTVA